MGFCHQVPVIAMWSGKGTNLDSAALSKGTKRDATAWSVQERLIAVVKAFSIRHTKEPHESKQRKGIYHDLEEKGHIPVEANGWMHCTLCGMQWSKARIKQTLEFGNCPRHEIWYSVGEEQIRRNHTPFVGSKLQHNGHTIHPSHTIGYLKGILFCKVCSCWTNRRMMLLVEACKMKPRNQTQRSRLKRMLNGEHPIAGKHLPKAEAHNEAPAYISKFIG